MLKSPHRQRRKGEISNKRKPKLIHHSQNHPSLTLVIWNSKMGAPIQAKENDQN